MARAPYKFGPSARLRFLDHLRETGHLGQSARAAGVHYTTVRRRLVRGHRLYDTALADEVEEARAAYADSLLAEAYRRGVEGWVERELYANGERVGEVRKYSDKLLIHLLRRYDLECRNAERVGVGKRPPRIVEGMGIEQVARHLSAPERLKLREALSQQLALGELAAERASAAEVGIGE